MADFAAALVEEMKTIVAFGGRVYPVFSPEANAGQGVPYLIFVSSPGLRTKTQDGHQSGRVVRGELNVVSARHLELESLAESVINKLVSFERRVIGTYGPFVQDVTYEQPVVLWEEKVQLYRCLIDFEVYY